MKGIPDRQKGQQLCNVIAEFIRYNFWTATYTTDTAAAMHRLTQSGMSQDQATAVVETLVDASLELVTNERLNAALNSQLIKIITSQIAVAALLFASLKYFGV